MHFGEIVENWATWVSEREGIDAALESVWRAKREYRAELAKKRALRLRFSEYRKTLPQCCVVA
jgi:hypothetical protein